MSKEMVNIQNAIRDVTLIDADTAEAAATSTLEIGDESRTFEALKTTALANCRLLYGSERMKFYDILLSMDEDEKTFCVALICSREGESKVLRTMVSDCPIKAIRTMVVRLQKDCFPLLMKIGAGMQTGGQLGYTNELTGEWEWAKPDRFYRPDGAVDDTQTLPEQGSNGPRRRMVDRYAPRGAPVTPRNGFKRARGDADSRMQGDNPNDLQYGEP